MFCHVAIRELDCLILDDKALICEVLICAVSFMHKILTSRDLSVHGIFLGPFCLQPKTCAKKTLSFADLSLSWRLIFVRQDEAASIFFWSWRQKRWWFTVTSFVMLQVGNHLHPTIWSLNLVLPKIGHRHSYSCDASSLLNFLHAFKTTDPMALGSVAVCPAMNIYIYIDLQWTSLKILFQAISRFLLIMSDMVSKHQAQSI